MDLNKRIDLINESNLNLIQRNESLEQENGRIKQRIKVIEEKVNVLYRILKIAYPGLEKEIDDFLRRQG